jgi:glycosyltransferase involved in cell wall biosynthesis
MIKLSILICSVTARLTKLFLLIQHLERQCANKPVEILWLGDNKQMTVGEKRNKLLSLAKGEYICYVDDDDWVSDDYVESILKAVETNPDAVCFECRYTNAETSVNNHVYFARRNFNKDDTVVGIRYRMVNHLNPVKRTIAQKIGFEERNFSEDTDYAIRLWNSRLMNTDVTIPRILYHYQFNPHTSETHAYNPRYIKREPNPPIKMDVITVSDANTQERQNMTQNAINSIASDDVNIIVLEKQPNVKYANAETFLQRVPFNYNQCLNEGAEMGNAELICFTNNDVLFPPNFLADIRRLFADTKPDVISVTNQHGFIHPNILSGYCFIMTRKAWNTIGKLNTDYHFWCADNVVTEQLKKHGLKELKSNILVHHTCSVSLKSLPIDIQQDYTSNCVQRFNHDYNQNVLGMGKC